MESVNISKLSTTEAALLSETLRATFWGWKSFDFCPALVWSVASVPISSWSSLGVCLEHIFWWGLIWNPFSSWASRPGCDENERVGAQKEQRFTPEGHTWPELCWSCTCRSVLSSCTGIISVTPNRAHQEFRTDTEVPSNKDQVFP